MKLANIVFTLLLVFVLAACSSQPDEMSTDVAYSAFDVNMYSLNQLICDPLNYPNQPADFRYGLNATLFSLRQGESPYSSVGEYMSKGSKSGQYLFFSDLNVPTRLFEQGFPSQTGSFMRDDSGVKLVENFALRFITSLALSADDVDGDYELALLSDDGAIWNVREEDGRYVPYVDNDGNHPTRMGCGSKTINMKRGETHIMNIEYYQGPRYHISLVPMWRHVSESTSAEPLCGVKGNSKYFDYNNNSEPQQAYKDLLARGWKPLVKENFVIPDSVVFNPCAGSQPPQISNVVLGEDEGNSIGISWETDRPATSQLLYTSVLNGEESMTKSDNILRTQHRVLLPKPEQLNSLDIQPVSISESFGKTIGEKVRW